LISKNQKEISCKNINEHELSRLLNSKEIYIMNTVIPPTTTTAPAQKPAGVPTIQPAPTTVDPPAPPKAKCDTFTPRPPNNLESMIRNIIFGTLPVNLQTPSACPSN
jgi:hypothetical protein